MNNNTEFAALYEFVTLINKYTNVFSKQQIYCTLKRTCMHTKILQLVHVIAKNIHVLIKRKKNISLSFSYRNFICTHSIILKNQFFLSNISLDKGI